MVYLRFPTFLYCVSISFHWRIAYAQLKRINLTTKRNIKEIKRYAKKSEIRFKNAGMERSKQNAKCVLKPNKHQMTAPYREVNWIMYLFIKKHWWLNSNFTMKIRRFIRWKQLTNHHFFLNQCYLYVNYHEYIFTHTFQWKDMEVKLSMRYNYKLLIIIIHLSTQFFMLPK